RHLAPSIALLLSLSSLLSAQAVRGGARRASAALTGAQIFKQRCAACHGARGQGTKRYAKPLTGSKSVTQLATFIAVAMPPGAARKWAGQDARKVAAYLYDAFYSPLAQARNRPARIELSRLTARQYRNAVTDLVGSFRPASQRGDGHGLRGEYFKS